MLQISVMTVHTAIQRILTQVAISIIEYLVDYKISQLRTDWATHMILFRLW